MLVDWCNVVLSDDVSINNVTFVIFDDVTINNLTLLDEPRKYLYFRGRANKGVCLRDKMAVEKNAKVVRVAVL